MPEKKWLGKSNRREGQRDGGNRDQGSARMDPLPDCGGL